jgi:hypothetical protein
MPQPKPELLRTQARRWYRRDSEDAAIRPATALGISALSRDQERQKTLQPPKWKPKRLTHEVGQFPNTAGRPSAAPEAFEQPPGSLCKSKLRTGLTQSVARVLQ